jgi:hypothetical protein
MELAMLIDWFKLYANPVLTVKLWVPVPMVKLVELVVV